MTTYRCYFLDAHEHIRAAENLEVERLDEAVDRATAMLAETPYEHLELWQGAARVYVSRDPVPRHQCHVYDGAPSDSLKATAAVIADKLAQNLRCLYLNSPLMVAGLSAQLTAIGVDLEQETGKGALILSSDQGHLADGRFDAQGLLAMLEAAVDQALTDGHAGLWACGDMSWELGGRCSPEALLDYEWGLEELFRKRPQLSGVCQYHAATLAPELVRHGLAAHRAAFINETLWRLNPHYLPPASKRLPHEDLGGIIGELCLAARPGSPAGRAERKGPGR